MIPVKMCRLYMLKSKVTVRDIPLFKLHIKRKSKYYIFDIIGLIWILANVLYFDKIKFFVRLSVFHTLVCSVN